MIIKAFGKNPSGTQVDIIKQSPNYQDGKFKNIVLTEINPNKVSLVKLLGDYFNKPANTKPGKALPFIKTDLLKLPGEKPTVIWFGHSSYLININGFIILVDPIFSGHASPVSFIGKSFEGSDNYKVDDFPVIDLLIITHDHYDHLDYETIKKINSKVNKIVTSLGVGAHLIYWGIVENKITALDWWEAVAINDYIEITATPARHFSGRGVTRDKTLWSSFVLAANGYKIFLGGDSGYGDHFKLIGEKFKSFDLALLECGQYGKDWPNIHMFPEEVVLAARDLNADIILPVHWAKFVLANHPWNEPVKRLLIAAKATGQTIVTPMIGQPFILGEESEQVAWWEFQ